MGIQRTKGWLWCVLEVNILCVVIVVVCHYVICNTPWSPYLDHLTLMWCKSYHIMFSFACHTWKCFIIINTVAVLLDICDWHSITSCHCWISIGNLGGCTLLTCTSHSEGWCNVFFHVCRYIWLKYDLDRSTTHPKFSPTHLWFKPITSRSWQYILCPCDSRLRDWAIRDLPIGCGSPLGQLYVSDMTVMIIYARDQGLCSPKTPWIWLIENISAKLDHIRVWCLRFTTSCHGTWHLMSWSHDVMCRVMAQGIWCHGHICPQCILAYISPRISDVHHLWPW